MKITFISPFPDLMAFGMRTISAYLKQHGHETQLIFIPDLHDNNIVFGTNRYDDKALDNLIPLCCDSDLIGITLMTNFYAAAVQITEKVKSGVKAPVIWGGVHATIRPEESLEHADMVCVGDGEEAVLELVTRMQNAESYRDVRNIWIKESGNIVRNKLRDLTHDLDVYPRPDYSSEEQYILHDGTIKPLTYELIKKYLERGSILNRYMQRPGYQTMTGRGCPHKCTYCINDKLKELYKNENYLRWRSTAHLIDELLWAKETFSYIGYVWISDDAFFARPKKDLEEFCREYKSKIGLPFSCLTSPMTLSEEKMEMLVDSGLIYLQMGVQSGSTKMLEVFNRKQMNYERLMRAFNIINKYKDRMFPPTYDFILDAPYEKDEDKIESLKLITQIPKPFQISPFNLVLYPGTKLYEKNKNDGMIQSEETQIYGNSFYNRNPSYLNLLFMLCRNGRFPSSLLKFLISSPTVGILNSKQLKPVLKLFYNCLMMTYRTAKKLVGRHRK